MLVLNNVSVNYGAIEALRGISMHVEKGEVVTLIGANGAGKTTTLRMLSGLMQPDTGTIHVDGSDVVADPIGSQRFMGLLPDSRGLYPRMTAREHIRYFGELRGLTAAALTERTERLIRRLGLEPLAGRKVAGFSQGERTKVALARALVHEPRNVILDEPTNGLDIMSTRAVRELIRGLRHDGCCVVFSSHIMQEVSALCDRIVVIAQGRVVADGTPDELRRQTGRDDLEDTFVALAGLDAEANG